MLLSILKCTLRRNTNEWRGPARPALQPFLESVKLERSVASKRVRIWARKTCVTAPPGGNLQSLEAVGAAVEQNAGSSVDLIASQEKSFLILQHVCRGEFFSFCISVKQRELFTKSCVLNKITLRQRESSAGDLYLDSGSAFYLFFLFFRVKLSPTAGR